MTSSLLLDAAGDSDLRGDLSRASVADLLELLSRNHRSGTLTVATRRGQGELRLRDGDVIDAVFRRHEGEKALFRLLAEDEGRFAFASGTGTALRRIEASTSALLAEGARQLAAVRELRQRLGSPDAALAAQGELPGEATELEREICRVLAPPRSLDALLEELSDRDIDILHAAEGLLASGHLRKVDGGRRAELAEADRLDLLAALLRRLARPGFGAAARLAFAGEPRRISALGHSASLLSGARVPASDIGAASMPRTLAVLELPEGAQLELTGLPLAAELSPLWSLALPGSAAVVQLDAAPCPPLAELTTRLDLPLLSATSLLGELDETDSVQVAALIRSALDQLAAR